MAGHYVKNTAFSLRAHPLFNEKWLQTEIADDPGLLGLGELDLIRSEKIQPGAGRLDLLLEDNESGVRYEVEVQLGQTDPSHIIRTIEYWDLERRLSPKYSHVAVIVAEQITSRFFNVISLFNRAIPIIAIQVQALAVDDAMTLVFTKILDLTALGDDDETETEEPKDRQYWENKAAPATLALTDSIVELVRATTEPSTQLKYNKHYIGIETNGVVTNFVSFRPRRQHVVMEFKIARDPELEEQLENSPLTVLPYDARWGRYRAQLTSEDLVKNDALLRSLITRAHDEYHGTAKVG